MASSRFRRAFDNLLSKWKSHNDAPRNPELVQDLAQSRLELDDARAEAKTARQEAAVKRRPLGKPPTKVDMSEEDQYQVGGYWSP